LWDGFEKIKARTEDGEKFTAVIQKYLQKRHETESKYARNLQHLNECFKTDLEIGTTLVCWQGLRDETQNLADARQAFCDQILELINTITNNLKEDKKNRAMLVAKGNKYVSELAKTEDAMKKARAKYVDLRKKQDRSQEAVQKAKSTGSSVNKLQKAAEKDEKRADKSDNEYRISVNTLKVAQDKFHDVDMPALLREFEQHEERRLQVTREYFQTFGEKQNPLGPQWIESTERFLAKVKEINIRSDLDLYVEKNRPDSDQPPPRAQYISYDGSVIQDVNGGAGASSAAKNKKKESKLPKLPGGGKKKKEPPTGEKGDKKTTISLSVNAGGQNPASPVGYPPSGGPSFSGGPPPTTPPADLVPIPLTMAGSAGAAADGDDGSASEEEKPNDRPRAALNPPVELVTIYAYEATEENELTFAEGETIYLLEKDDSGWWRGRNKKGQEGVFPSNFVEVVGEEGGTGNTGTIEINAEFQALYDYEAEDENELTIKEGEILHVVSETDGWYFGTNKAGQEGNFPSNFVEPYEPTNNTT